MVYTYSTEKVYTKRVKQYVDLETNDSQAINTFLKKIHDSNIADNLNRDLNTDPNKNLEQFLDIFSHLKNMYLPKRRVKLNKRKHKIQPWMTTAILKSIKSRDKLYKLLMLTSRDSPDYLKVQRNLQKYHKKEYYDS